MRQAFRERPVIGDALLGLDSDGFAIAGGADTCLLGIGCFLAGRLGVTSLKDEPVAFLFALGGVTFFATITVFAAVGLFTGGDFFGAADGRGPSFAAEVFGASLEALVVDAPTFFLEIDFKAVALAAFAGAAFAAARDTFLAAALCSAQRFHCASAMRALLSSLKPLRGDAPRFFSATLLCSSIPADGPVSSVWISRAGLTRWGGERSCPLAKELTYMAKPNYL